MMSMIHVSAPLLVLVKVIFHLVSWESCGIAVSVKNFGDGMSYLRSTVCNVQMNPSYSITMYACKAMAINQAIDMFCLFFLPLGVGGQFW